MRVLKIQSRFIELFGNAERTKPLSEYIGATFPGEWGEDDVDGTGVKVIRTTNFTNSGKLDLTNVVTRKIDRAKIDKKHLSLGDIILERSGGTADNPVGRVVYFEAEGTYLFNNFTQLLRCKDGVNSLFVFYSLFNYYHTNKSEIRSMGNKTTGIQNLKMEKYWDIPIADASPEQQEQFVSLYKQADKSKFNGFKSRFIEEFGNPIECQESFKNCIGDYCQVISGYPFKSELFNEEGNGRPLIRIRDVVRGYTETYTTESCDVQYVVRKDDLLIGMDGIFEISPWKSEDALLNQRVCMIVPKSDKITKNYIIYAVQPVLTSIENQTNATTVKHISAGQVSSIRIPDPDKDKVKAFDSFVCQSDKSKYLS
jgi:restriction endonuclease S subunit